MGIIEPNMPASAYKTYRIVSPIATHYRPATCAEVGCEPYQRGWVTTIDEGTELGQRQAHFIRANRGGFTETRTEGGLTEFRFEAGQRCFASDSHRVSLDRPELYLVQGGDWRGNPTGYRRQHANAADWVDDFGEHQQRLADLRERG